MNAMNESQSQRLKLMAERFSEWLEAINYSPKTRVNYTRDVKLFLTWLSENTIVNSLLEVTPAQLQQYQIWLYNFERHQDNGKTIERRYPGESTGRGAQVLLVAAERTTDRLQPGFDSTTPKATATLATWHIDKSRSATTHRSHTDNQAARHS